MMEGLNRIITGMEQEVRKFEVISNNLANISTTGFKSNLVEFTVAPGSKKMEKKNSENNDCSMITDFNQGVVNTTNNSFDFAIEGEGFFAIETKNGTRYTRDGSFKTDGEGALVTHDNNFVLDSQNKHIYINNARFTVNTKGEIVSDGKKVAEIKLVTFENPAKLVKLGFNLFDNNEMEELKTSAEIQQGAIESSNVNVMMEMAKMISIMRKYESYQKIVNVINDSMQAANQQVGKV